MGRAVESQSRPRVILLVRGPSDMFSSNGVIFTGPFCVRTPGYLPCLPTPLSMLLLVGYILQMPSPQVSMPLERYTYMYTWSFVPLKLE